MALWKQVLVTLVIAVAAVVGWGAFDPGARDRLAGLGLIFPRRREREFDDRRAVGREVDRSQQE